MKTCKLCNQSKSLSKKSHIIPYFMYEGMFVDNEPIYTGPFIVTDENKHLIKKSRIGEYESDILCLDCEQKLLGHYYDDYVATIFNGNSSAYDPSIKFENFNSELGFSYVQISNIDEQRFRLFLLSVLFRISISKRAVFNDIRLDEKTFEKIRVSIYDKRLIDNFNIYISILCYRHLNLEFGNIIAMPATIKLNEDLVAYSLLINGYIYFFYLTDNIDALSTSMKFQSSDNIKIQMLDKDQAIKLIFAHFGIKAQQPT